MTVSYNTKVTDTGISSFIRLFFRWKGSVWKAVYKELALWLLVYFMLNGAYRFLMADEQQRVFERLCCFFYTYSDFIPLTFLLGFFVNLVVSRWWHMWQNIGWIDSTALYLVSYISGDDDRSRMYRRNIVRYLLFYQVLVFRDISSAIRDRFPTLETLVPSGYLTREELEDYLSTPTVYKNYYTPVRWAMNLVRQARNELRVGSDHAVQDLFKRILDYRAQITTLLTYDFQPIPLLYTVVVCLTVRLYFVIALLGRQILVTAPSPEYIPLIDLYFPVMTIIQFIFYMGWMKVAEALLNPFGEDDDDFELNWLIDRNFEVGFVIADQNYDKPLVKDKHWDNKYPEPLYSISTMNAPIHPLIGSAVRQEGASRRGSSQPRRESNMPNAIGVIMVPRLPSNCNEDSGGCETDSTVRVRSRKVSVDLVAPTLVNGVLRRLSHFTGVVSPVDAEVGPEDDYVFTRTSSHLRQTTRQQREGDSIKRKHVPSIICEEDGKEKEHIENALQFYEKADINLQASIDKLTCAQSINSVNVPEKFVEKCNNVEE